MADTTSISTRRTVVTTVVILAVLALILAALAGVYFLMTRPASLADQGSKDRNYLFSIYGFEGDLLRRPTGVGLDDQGNIYVADTGNRRIVVFDGQGNFVTTFGDAGKGALQLWEPIAVAVAPDGRSYVVDKSEKKMVIFDPQHKPIKSITFPESPLGVTVANGNLFATTDSGIVIGTLDGKFLTGYVKRGKAAGSFDRPANVAVGKDGTLYVADSLNYRIQAIGANGKVKWVYGAPLPPNEAVNFNGSTRKFGLPSSVAVDDNGYVYVVDGLSSELVVLDSAGKYVQTIGDIGHEDGTFYYPDGITYKNGRLVVADKFNDRVEVFSDPTARSFGDTLSGAAPYGLLLLALPLIAIPFLRRGSRYVVAPSFAARLLTDPHGPEVADALKRVIGAPALVSEHAEDYEGLKWVKRDTQSASVDELVGRYGLERSDAEALDIALRSKGKSVLLSDNDQLNAAAAELEVSAVTYNELLEAMAAQASDTGEGEAA